MAAQNEEQPARDTNGFCNLYEHNAFDSLKDIDYTPETIPQEVC